MILKFSKALQEDKAAIFGIYPKCKWHGNFTETLLVQKVNGRESVQLEFNANNVTIVGMGLYTAQWAKAYIVDLCGEPIMQLDSEYEDCYNE